jgi:hypothetical protein
MRLRTKSESVTLFLHGPPAANDQVLTPEELAQFQRQLSMPSEYSVIEKYQDLYKQCAFHGEILPPSWALQQLVCAWKVLRRSEKRKVKR